jgi:UDP-N-acetylmuramoylalanine--D-glutamate ligase
VNPRPPLDPGPYLVVGLARSGRAAGLALAARGETVLGVDAGHPDVSDLLAGGVQVALGDSGVDLLAGVRTVVKSPGVPATAPVLVEAAARGLPIVGELELAWRLLPNEFIAVTGTNGKTTTTELIGHIHAVAGEPVAVAGNVGTALASLVGRLDDAATVVCEASSFQLEDAVHFAPEGAVLLNLSPDHLDRHGTFEAYRAAKLRVFARQGNDDVAVAPIGIGIEDLGGCARRVCFGTTPQAELSWQSETLWWDHQPLIAVDEVRLRGEHNVHNAMAAAAITLARGLESEAVAEALRSFAGVAHRLEELAPQEGVLYVNDSKATNVASAVVALASFAPASVHLILGGEGKGQDFTPLRSPVARAARAVYLIGRDGPQIAAALAGSEVPVIECVDLERAVEEAAGRARGGEVVLLSPACASFDQYPDFEARGEHFRTLVARRRVNRSSAG